MAAPVKLAFVGAGGIHFGNGADPWDHASRLEKLPYPLQFVAVVDLNIQLAQQQIEKRQSGAAKELWATAKAYKTCDDMLAEIVPDCCFVGLPPFAHGGTSSKNNVELVLARAGVHLFLEKPVSVQPLAEVEELAKELDELSRSKNLIFSVGYMLRYHWTVAALKERLDKMGVPISAMLSRYNCTATYLGKGFWWDAELSGGPIIEQGTHFCDLHRYLGGEPEDVVAYAVPFDCAAGNVNHLMPKNDKGEPIDIAVPRERRIPRTTTAMWRFPKTGAVGTHAHACLLEGAEYHTEFEVWAAGYRFCLQDPYNHPRLTMRAPGSDAHQEITFDEFCKGKDGKFEQEDCYYTELSVFVNGVKGLKEGSLTLEQAMAPIRSSFADAMLTYRLTWAVRLASEK